MTTPQVKTQLESIIDEISNDPKAPLKVPAALIKPDILTVNTQKIFSIRKENKFYHDTKTLLMPIRVEKHNEKRALLLMDTFIKLLRYRGHSIDRIYGSMCILVNGVEIPFCLRETNKRIPPKPGTFNSAEYIPTNLLALKIGRFHPVREWRDGNLKLESQLPKIVARLEIDAAAEKEQMDRARQFRENYENEKKLKEQKQLAADNEMKKFKSLLIQAERYNSAHIIRNYIKAVQENHALDNDISEWVAWANNKADWYDPIINKPDDLLGVIE